MLLTFSCLCLGNCFAQTELSLHTTYEVPLDELKWIFKPANNYQLSISSIDKYKNKRTALGVALGYANFTPREEVFYYLVNEGELGTISYTDYQVVQVALSPRWDYIFNRLELFFGAYLGYQYVIYGYESADSYQTEDAKNIVSRVLMAPKAGAAFLLSEHVAVFAHLRYNCSLGFGSGNKSDRLNYSLAPGMGLNFRF